MYMSIYVYGYVHILYYQHNNLQPGKFLFKYNFTGCVAAGK